MRVHRLPDAEDPLDDCLSPNGQLGTVTVDFASRRRMRTNGIIRERDSSGFTLQVQQAYANCPKFIQARSWTIDAQPRGGRQSLNMAELTEDARGIIEAADTFFIASHHPEYGADVSHRGGMPGFVQVLDERTLWFPDYKGNSMFNTLGNLNGHPEAGLLFLDFDSGSMLQLTGTVQVEWDTDSISAVAGAERIIRFHVRQGRLTAHAMPLTWTFMSYSSVNPK
jgi:predicted pyridoxine 5'-phosphate oxidase superfamily flavin-nucleotide-binding protein